MMWFLLVLSITLIVLIPVNVYIASKVHEFEIIKRVNNKILSWLFSFPFLLITILLLIWNPTNANVIVLHFAVILVLCELFYNFVCMFKRKYNIKYGQEVTVAIALVITMFYLGYAYYVAHNVVETHYQVVANKDIGVDKFRIVQITDSHIGATMSGEKFYNYMLEINKTNPDIVVITGDYVDDDTKLKDMVKACEGLGELKTKYGVYFIYGNHDKGYFDYREFDNDKLRKELRENNVTILEDIGVNLVGNLYLIGRQDKSVINRRTAEQLMSYMDPEKYVIVLDHQPNDYKNESEAGIDLVLSGHTHGGQVFPLQIIDKIIGTNNQIYGLEKIKSTTFIVSSGIGDWAVKFKTGTKAEYVVIDIINK